MAAGMNRKRLAVGLCLITAALITFLCSWRLLAARFGTPAVRQVVLAEWVNQKNQLSILQKKVLISLLYQDVGDPAAVRLAISVLNAHLKDDEQELVRHLAYVALTANNSGDCAVALAGLKSVSAKHKKIAVGAFLYHLRNSDPNNKGDAFKLAFAISGLAKFSVREALPEIEQLTNHENTLLSGAAEAAVFRLHASQEQK